MIPSEPSRFGVNAEDIRSYPWQELLSVHPEKNCKTYFKVFGRAANERRDAADDLGERVYSFLNVVASFFPNFGSDMSPYRPMREDSDGTRSLIPDDLTDQDLEALNGLVQEIEDPEYRARVADVLWVCRKDFKAAQLAVPAFLESAEELKGSDRWFPYLERLDRAAVISARRGFESQRDAVITVIESAIQEIENDLKSELICARLMGILLLLNAGDPTSYSNLSERLAREFANEGDWHFSEHYWHVAESWHRRSKDEIASQRAMIEAAECNISRAEEALAGDSPQFGFAAHWMGEGLEGLRRAKAEPARIKAVHRKFLSLQKQALSELSPLGFDPESFPGLKENREMIQEASIKYVSGLNFEKAVWRLAFIGDPTKVDELMENECENSEDLIWDKLVGSNQLDRDGKVSDIMPPMGLRGEDPDQVAFRKKLVQTASMFGWPLAVEWRIEPARRAIATEHPIRTRDLAFLVTNNPFIPQGREGIYLRGIQAGFFGDWLVAMHLLIPQLEASLRRVLQQHGGVTSTLKAGIQMEKDINELLWDETVEKVFGSDFVFDLRGILIERFGCNMRNDLAHGLMDEGDFHQTAEPIYLWWLVIRLCWLGYRAIPEELPEEN